MSEELEAAIAQLATRVGELTQALDQADETRWRQYEQVRTVVEGLRAQVEKLPLEIADKVRKLVTSSDAPRQLRVLIDELRRSLHERIEIAEREDKTLAAIQKREEDDTAKFRLADSEVRLGPRGRAVVWRVVFGILIAVGGFLARHGLSFIKPDLFK